MHYDLLAKKRVAFWQASTELTKVNFENVQIMKPDLFKWWNFAGLQVSCKLNTNVSRGIAS